MNQKTLHLIVIKTHLYAFQKNMKQSTLLTLSTTLSIIPSVGAQKNVSDYRLSILGTYEEVKIDTRDLLKMEIKESLLFERLRSTVILTHVVK